MPPADPDALAFLERQLTAASSERRAQTSAFERALERGFDRLDRRLNGMTKLGASVVLLALVLLGADRYGSVVVEGLGLRVSTTAAAEVVPVDTVPLAPGVSP